MNFDLLNRRGFLGSTATGLSSIALTHLLNQNSLLRPRADDREEGKRPIRPTIDPKNPNRARAPHFSPAAKNVLVIFLSLIHI